jgi:hypothetical protein
VYRSTKTFLDRLDLYLARLKADLEQENYPAALADCAELAEISRRFWLHIQALLRAHQES